MRLLSRVVWNEGMHLAQHHFQAQSRYVEDLVGFSTAQLFFEPYGVSSLELDAEALLNGTVSVTHGRGTMPDGFAFLFPDDAPPPPLDIRELFSPTQESQLVLLALPAYRAQQANVGSPTNGASADHRYRAARRSVADETTGADERPVELAHGNFRLLLEGQATEATVVLPIARVRRDGAGHFVYDAEYVPPCVRIGASGRLMQILAGLVETLEARTVALLEQRDAGRSSLAEYASREIAEFWLSHTLHSALPGLRHRLGTRSGHPEALYVELARLAGALCTFSLTSHARDVPAYDHVRLGDCFAALDRHIREHLEIVLPSASIAIRLERASGEQLEESSALDPQALEEYRDFLVRSSPFFHLGRGIDRRCLEGGDWFLGVRSSASQAEVIGRIPTLAKVCSGKHIARLVKDAYPGLALEHVGTPPTQISPRADTQYFRIRHEGGCWTSIAQTAEVGVYVPAAIPDIELDLVVVPPGTAGRD